MLFDGINVVVALWIDLVISRGCWQHVERWTNLSRKISRFSLPIFCQQQIWTTECFSARNERLDLNEVASRMSTSHTKHWPTLSTTCIHYCSVLSMMVSIVFSFLFVSSRQITRWTVCWGWAASKTCKINTEIYAERRWKQRALARKLPSRPIRMHLTGVSRTSFNLFN